MTTVFIISAPSGSGKSTLVSRILANDPQLRFSVSYTTRAPRGNEKPGESYIYITRSEFESRLANNEFLEHAEVFGNYYGTNREILRQAQTEGKDLILDIDVQGARQLKERIPQAVVEGLFSEAHKKTLSKLVIIEADNSTLTLKRH